MTTPKDSASIEAFEKKKPIHPCEPWFDENWNKLLMDESKTWFDITCEIWQAAIRSVEPAKIVLPEKRYAKAGFTSDYEYSLGFNECLDAIKRLNPSAAFKIEGE
jgi:hypothetical protein